MDDEWKVVVEKPPRSKRHAQEDDDVQRPDAAEHMFDAPSLAVPLTNDFQRRPRAPRDGRGVSPIREANSEHETEGVPGQNVTEEDVPAANPRGEDENDYSAWLEEGFDDEDETLPYGDTRTS